MFDDDTSVSPGPAAVSGDREWPSPAPTQRLRSR